MAEVDDDVMMSDWLDMVQKKNELVREESELTYRFSSFCSSLYSTVYVFYSMQ